MFPIDVDVFAVRREAVEAQLSETCQRMIGSLLGRKLLVGVDRLDDSKGLVERLSRTDVSAYSANPRQLEQAAGRTNGRFADTDRTPIRYLNRIFLDRLSAACGTVAGRSAG